jgi:hypothetical protein
MEKYYVFVLAAFAGAIGAAFAVASYFGIPWWGTLIGILMVSFGCLVLLADMNRPSGGSPSFKTTLLLLVLFLPLIPVLIPAGLILLVVVFIRGKLTRRR